MLLDETICLSFIPGVGHIILGIVFIILALVFYWIFDL
jgi:hypothetical protein